MKKILFGYFALHIFQISNAQTGCSPSTSSADLDIGNVRARIHINGDMWWDLAGNAKYEVPKGSGKHSLFSGALWIGGKDAGSNLKVAAQTYRQSGSDFWPGPIDTLTCTITSPACTFYDQHWKITRQEVADFVNGGTPGNTIINWPGNSNPTFGAAYTLAPFYDRANDGIYDYTDGDYPKYEFGNQSSDIYNRLNGDQTIWWVFNDVGNIHTESGSMSSLGIEIQAQAYAYCTNDIDLQNTTFYSYKIINRCSGVIHQTYIGNYVDVDLGNYLDDYVGCDVGRMLGYAYNGDNFDEGINGYGQDMPAIGIDILDGPLADVGDGLDNDRDLIIDEPDEKILMSGFLYYNNAGTPTGNPSTPVHYYNYMSMVWKDNSPLTYGGNGYNPGSIDSCIFMFPGNSDPNNFGTRGVNYGFHWSERQTTIGGSANNPGDRRFLMSSGKFSFFPGAVHYYTRAVIWAQRNGGPDSSLAALIQADDRIQSFFDSNFNNIPTCNVTIGINEIDRSTYSIGPNPVSDRLYLRTNDNDAGLKMTVFLPDGKLILKEVDFNTSISVVKWAAGIYLYRISDRQGKSSQGKFTVIQ